MSFIAPVSTDLKSTPEPAAFQTPKKLCKQPTSSTPVADHLSKFINPRSDEIGCALGPKLNDDEVKLLKKYDTRLSFYIKHGNSKSAKDDFLDVEAVVIQKVVKKCGILKQEMKEWDNNYFLNNLRTPTIQNYKENGRLYILSHYNTCKHLLREWKVSF